MDEKRSELISRALDDDLSGPEWVEFEDCLADDDDFAAAFEAMRQLRRAVALVADEMTPPSSLDAVMKPLLVGIPTPPRRVRPAFRWLGAAAAVLLGVTVTLEVARRNPTPTLTPDSRPRFVNQDDREIFELAALPTAVPNPNRPLGATDHLLEEEPAHPLAPEPQALEILGPLTDEEHAEIAGAGPVPAPAGVFEKHHTPITNQESREEKGAAVRRVITTPAGGGGREQHTSLPPSRALEQATPEKSLPAAMDHKQPDGAEESRRPATVPVLVLLADVEIWAGRSSRCPESRWTVVVDVQDGSVTGAERLPGDRKNRAGEECLLLDFVGSFIAGVADGRHVAEVVLQ